MANQNLLRIISVAPPGFVDKLIYLITNSGPLGFAMFFAGAVVFILRYLKPEAVAFIDPSALGYILYIALFGAGLVFLKAWAWLNKQSKLFWAYLKQRNRYVTAADRLDDLLPEELKALCWMLINDNLKIIGRRIESPFDGLIRKGFLIVTDGKEIYQVFRVHPYVKAKSERVLEMVPNGLRDKLKGITPPWEEDRRGRMRI
jgi:hypothetical protein